MMMMPVAEAVLRDLLQNNDMASRYLELRAKKSEFHRMQFNTLKKTVHSILDRVEHALMEKRKALELEAAAERREPTTRR